MATAKRVRVTRVIEKGVVLALSEEEAQLLLEITRLVAGDPDGLRGHADSIRNALTSAGFESAYPNVPVSGTLVCDRHRS